MFFKSYKAKPTTAVKNSDKKKLWSRLSSQTNVKDTGLKEDKSAVVTVCKLSTHTNDQFTLYFEDSIPVLLENRGGILLPTIYLLWRQPALVPSFKVFNVHPIVISKLKEGADLMAPGIIRNKTNLIRKLDKHDYIFIRGLDTSTQTLTPILAICQILMASYEIQESNLNSGRLAKVVHVYGDYLWEQGHQKNFGQDEIDLCNQPHPLPMEEEEFPALDQLEIAGENSGEAAENIESGAEIEATPQAEAESQSPNTAISEETDPEIDPTQAAQDDMLMTALLHSLKTTFRQKPAPELPILNSAFYTKFILPNIKPHPDQPQLTFNLKSTSFKNLPNFLGECEKLGLLALKINEKNHTLVCSVDTKHSLVRGYNELAVAENLDNLHLKIGPGEAKNPPSVATFFSITSPAGKILNLPKGTILPNSDIRQYLQNYLKNNELLLSGGDCQLDPPLAHFCDLSEPVVNLKKLNERFFNKLSLHFVLSYASRNIPLKNKNLTQIKINIVKRMGNKKVTIIAGLEFFHLDIEAFAQKLKIKLQASTTIEKLSPGEASSILGGGVGNMKGMEFRSVIAQGGQTKLLKEFLLENYCLNEKYFKIEDKTGGKKKK